MQTITLIRKLSLRKLVHESVEDVLDYVNFSDKALVRTMENWVSRSVKEGKITLQEGKEYLNIYRSGLYGYTYLE